MRSAVACLRAISDRITATSALLGRQDDRNSNVIIEIIAVRDLITVIIIAIRRLGGLFVARTAAILSFPERVLPFPCAGIYRRVFVGFNVQHFNIRTSDCRISLNQ